MSEIKDWEGTKGEVTINKIASLRVVDSEGTTVANTSSSQSGFNLKVEQANAIFIADAFNTRNKSNLSPSELLEQLEKYKKAVKLVLGGSVDNEPSKYFKGFSDLKQLIETQ